MERNFTEQELIRRGKLSKFKELNIDPFGSRFDRTDNSKTINDKYLGISSEELENLNVIVKVAGRIMTKRGKGKAGFMHIQDRFGQIQIYLKLDNIGEAEYDLFDKSDLGDIVGIDGTLFITHTGELSIRASKYTHLVKALRPLPEKFHGLTDVEERYRRRYVDLITNDDSRYVAFMRPRIMKQIRSFMDIKGFSEVETPVLQPLLTGASARPFVTHHNALDMEFYLRIALELPLKRLLVGGMEAVYEIGRTFRNEGVDTKHNPEFTLMEAYLAYSNLEGIMDLTEEMFKDIAKNVFNKYVYTWCGNEINLENKWKRITMVDCIKEYSGVDFSKDMTFEEASAIAKEHNIRIEEHFKTGHIINSFFEKYCEEKLIQPTFIYNYPVEVSPLTKRDSNDTRFVQRFEFFIGSKEFGNAYTELNDPDEQLDRFEDQLREKNLGNDETSDIDMDFIEALEYGMPPAGGVGYGIDRMCMLFLEKDSIRDVILFPHMKDKK